METRQKTDLYDSSTLHSRLHVLRALPGEGGRIEGMREGEKLKEGACKSRDGGEGPTQCEQKEDGMRCLTALHPKGRRRPLGGGTDLDEAASGALSPGGRWAKWPAPSPSCKRAGMQQQGCGYDDLVDLQGVCSDGLGPARWKEGGKGGGKGGRREGSKGGEGEEGN